MHQLCMGAEERLWACSRLWGEGLELTLANATGTGDLFPKQAAGAVLRVEPREDRVWVIPFAQAATLSSTQGISRLAHEQGTFALWLRGPKGDSYAVAWGHASPTATRGPRTHPGLEEALHEGWGTQAGTALLHALADTPGDTLLPQLHTQYDVVVVVVVYCRCGSQGHPAEKPERGRSGTSRSENTHIPKSAGISSASLPSYPTPAKPSGRGHRPNGHSTPLQATRGLGISCPAARGNKGP